MFCQMSRTDPLTKKSLLLFTASAAMHSLVVVSLYGPFWGKKKSMDDAVIISYVIPPKNAAPTKVLPRTSFPHALRQKISGMTTQPALAVKKSAPAVKESSELLADPVRGKVFLSYFSKIKGRIHETVRKNAPLANVGQGSVAVNFVLWADGSLERVSVMERGSDAAATDKDFAVKCVKEASPFSSFPKELDLAKISFSVTLLFE